MKAELYVSGGGSNGTVWVIDSTVSPPAPVPLDTILLGGTSPNTANGVTVSEDSTQVYTVGNQAFIRVIDAASNTIVGSVALPFGDAQDIRVLGSFDNGGPETTAVTPASNPATVGTTIVLSANIHDTNTGGSDIASADFEIRASDATVVVSGTCDAGSGFSTVLPCPVDMTFDEVSENVEVTIASPLLPDVYETCIRGTDATGDTGAYSCAMLAVYDPEGGFVTGGGWIQSSASYCTICGGAEGKANFGFVSKYRRGANVPTGNTKFVFTDGNFNFKSTEYEWLVVTGQHRAQFKGSGTINGSGDYGFLLTAREGNPAVPGSPVADTFRIKIWDKGTDTTVAILSST